MILSHGDETNACPFDKKWKWSLRQQVEVHGFEFGIEMCSSPRELHSKISVFSSKSQPGWNDTFAVFPCDPQGPPPTGQHVFLPTPGGSHPLQPASQQLSAYLVRSILISGPRPGLCRSGCEPAHTHTDQRPWMHAFLQRKDQLPSLS